MKPLTKKQQEVYSFVMEFRSENGYSPSLGEIADEFAMSHQGVNCHVKAIVEKGWLNKQPGKSRSLIPALLLTRPQAT